MADQIRKVAYRYLMLADRPGQGARALRALRDAGVNLEAVHAFPTGGGESQVDVVARDDAALSRAASQAGINLSDARTAFLAQGEDRPGAAAEILEKLGGAGINVVAMDAVCANGRYGALFWVRREDVGRAADVLGAS